ncbi:zinc finger protein [Histoplasma capsulatum]|uniref:Zinc finger protein n=1 Tax=Ajellomyces capsulatus TaxID=5037 RepID=A0A8A1LXI2_AJECA|nr:zinc finger protein [Histoplasma capsulatum]
MLGRPAFYLQFTSRMFLFRMRQTEISRRKRRGLLAIIRPQQIPRSVNLKKFQTTCPIQKGRRRNHQQRPPQAQKRSLPNLQSPSPSTSHSQRMPPQAPSPSSSKKISATTSAIALLVSPT